jgi:hypothetical protein
MAQMRYLRYLWDMTRSCINIANQLYTADKHWLNRLIQGVWIQEKPVSLESWPLRKVCSGHEASISMHWMYDILSNYFISLNPWLCMYIHKLEIRFVWDMPLLILQWTGISISYALIFLCLSPLEWQGSGAIGWTRTCPILLSNTTIQVCSWNLRTMNFTIGQTKRPGIMAMCIRITVTSTVSLSQL